MKIDDNWSIETDANNCTLTFSEQRERETKSGEKEQFTFSDSFYFPTVNLCLKRYLELSQKESADVKDCIRITEEAVGRIMKMRF